jgi:hypothetical protein
MKTIQITSVFFLVLSCFVFAEPDASPTLRPLFPVIRVAPVTAKAISGGSSSSSGTLELERFLYTVKKDGHDVGSAFVVKDDDGVWMISNYHVVSGSNDLEFVNIKASGETFTLPEEVQLAEGRDAFRFKVNQTNGLSFAQRIDFDEVVYAYGNSGGAGVMTKNKGTVAGKGNMEIEVTCDIIPGNSGGPVINTAQEVVGMATYIIKSPTWQLDDSVTMSDADRARVLQRKSETEGTRYSEPRRFAIHLVGAKWQSLSREQFQHESVLYGDEDDSYNSFCESVLEMCHLESPDSDAAKHFGSSWVGRYERDLEKYGSHYKGSYRVVSSKEDQFLRKYIRWINDLADFSGEKAEDLTAVNSTITSCYLRDKLAERVTSLSAMAEGLREAADSLDD